VNGKSVLKLEISGTAVFLIIVAGIIAWLWFRNKRQIAGPVQIASPEELVMLERKPMGSIGWPSN